MAIKFKTTNIDGREVDRQFDNVEEMRKDWFSEYGTTLPGLDDKLVSAEINGQKFNGEKFEDLANYLDLDGGKMNDK